MRGDVLVRYTGNMIDHVGYTIENFQKSKAFYVAALGALGYVEKFSDDVSMYLAHPVSGGVWFGQMGEPVKEQIHLAFSAASKEQVDDFYRAGLAHGGVDNGAPGPREQYGPRYFAAFVIDPNGHNIEAVYRGE